MPITVNDVVEALFARAPRELAEPWDNVGLVVGDPRARVRRALLCVDATQLVLAEALSLRAQLVLAHHPPFVEGLKTIRADNADSTVAYRAAREGISICAMHTNLDYAPDGLCLELARLAGITDIRPLSAAGGQAFVKLVIFVPESHVAALRTAISAAGGGRIGRYDECSFAVAGEGTFRPLPGATPYVGCVGRLERAQEVRLEMIVPRSAVARAVRAMEAAHPYEEVVYDLYPLANAWPNSARGAFGRLPRAMTLGGFAARVKRALRAFTVRVGGDERRRIRTVAVGSGSAGHLVGDAIAAGVDALLLGEIRHSDALRARASGLSLIEAGHFATERPAVDLMRRWLEADLGSRIEVVASRAEADPFTGRQAGPRRRAKQRIRGERTGG